ncbi:MAG TPA: heme exporter protein CcmB [Acidimicrobiia bacterium]|jgi:heme exporter protein B
MSFWGQAATIARHELKVESRAGEAFTIVLPFGIVALMALPFALGADLPLISRVGPGVFWVITLVFGLQVALRPSSYREPAQRDLMALLGVDPAARYTGRCLGSGLLLAGVGAALALAMVVLYSPDPIDGWPVLVGVGLLFVTGLVQLGVLASDLTAGLRGRALLAPLLATPLAIPLLLGASQAQEELARGGVILPWVLLLVAADLILAVSGVLSARPLEEAAE